MIKKKPFNKTLKLQTKFTISHLVIATIPMLVLGIFFYVKLYDMIIADTIRTEQQHSAEAVPYIDDFVDSVQDAYETVSICAHSEEPNALEKNLSAYIKQSFITDVKIYVSSESGNEYLADGHENKYIRPLSHAKGTYWYGIFVGRPSLTTLYCPSFYLSSYEIDHYGNLAYIEKSQIMLNGQLEPCYTAIYFSKDKLNHILSENISDDIGVAYLVNDRDSLVATSNEALSGVYHFDYDVIQEYFMSSNNFIEKQILGETVYAVFYNIQGPKWYMVVALSSAPIMKKAISVMLLFIGVYILCIIIAFFIATSLSNSITHRLTSIINQMNNVRYGPPVPLPESQTKDEIGELINNYNHMTTLIHNLMDAQEKASEELRIAEFNSLQAQINPHFLYNTMDMINWLSQQGRSKDVTIAISNLSRFYKLTLSRKNSISTIEDELEHISIYVTLQNMRFHDTIELLIDMPDELLEHSIPKLTFQPIVENAILHGILEKEQKMGTIVVTGWIDGESIIILISDDGVGMSQEVMNNILSGNVTSKQGSSIGVYNTHQRLQILYGKEYGLTYSSAPGKGTEVQIRIPLS